MDAMGGTFVGGSSTAGWSLVDPTAEAAAFGIATPSTPALTTLPSGLATPYGVGTVGGSWSPEPASNDAILYGHYSSTGAISVPQAYFGQQATAFPAATATPGLAPATTGAVPAATPTVAEPTKPKPAKRDASEAPKRRKAADGDGGGGKRESVTVKSGDTLSKIAARHGVSWQRLHDLNRGVIGGNPNLIRPGQRLRLP